MKNKPCWLSLVVAFLAWCLLHSPLVSAQAQKGNGAVYPTTGGPVPSTASIDAFALQGQADICATIYGILKGTSYLYPSQGAVIDARGINTGLDCTGANSNPWGVSTGYQNKPSIILLPPGVIKIPSTWVLPNGTRLIGEGVGVTTVSAGSLSGPMIQFGDVNNCPSHFCSGISVENLELNGNGQALTGIQNYYSQDLSYVDHVTLFGIAGTGLDVGSDVNGLGNAQGSGPYSNITFDTNQATTGICARLSASGTRGIHGLTCISENTVGDAIYVDSSNNSLEDIRIMGFDNGIVVGMNAVAQGDVLLNVYGDTIATGIVPPPVNVVLISTNAKDLSIVGVRNKDAGGINSTINDTLTSTKLTDTSVAMYILGESSNPGFTRFTTSANAPSWLIGTQTPSACATGGLFSSASSGALSVCKPGNSWQVVVQ